MRFSLSTQWLRLTNGTSARDRKTSLGAQITDGTVIGTGIAKYDCAAPGKTSKQDYFALGLRFATHLIGIDPRRGFRWIAGLSWPPHGVYPGVLFGQLYVNTNTHIQIQIHIYKYNYTNANVGPPHPGELFGRL